MKILKTTSFDIPIISVGNITVGGTGKTPHTEFLINILKKDYKTAVLSRGYKRKTKGFVLGNLDSTSKQIGDEPKQMKQKFNEVTVAVCESRVKGVKRLLQENNDLDVILLDDAFQHRYIKPGLSILLIDYNRPVTDDHFIPYGNLRDNFNQTHRANIIIVTKTPENVKPIDMRVMETSLELMAFQSIYFTKIGYGDLTPVFKKEALMLDIEIIKNQKYSILLVSGIASPTPFIDFVKSFSTDIETLEFPDHHIFTEKDKNKISDVFNMLKNEKKIIITTEKDAMRFTEIETLNPEIKKSLFYVPIDPIFLNNQGETFKSHILNFVNKETNQNHFYSTKRQYYSNNNE